MRAFLCPKFHENMLIAEENSTQIKRMQAIQILTDLQKMEIIEELLYTGEERVLSIAKLLQLIKMHQNSFEKYKKVGSPNLIVEQY